MMIYAVPHFHFDFEWWKRYGYYAADALEILEKALELLEKNPDFKFTIDQYYALLPVLKKRRDDVLRYIRKGRIEIVGGTLVAPDENIPMGEALIRQIVYGKRRLQSIGVDCTTGWMIDEFGHVAQLPQILSKCGMWCVAFQRGIDVRSDHPTDFVWIAPDGSSVIAHWLCTGYGGMISLYPLREMRMRDYETEMLLNLSRKGKRGATDAILVPFGTDFTVPTEDWIEFVKRWNSERDEKIRFSTPGEYFEAIRNARLPEVSGEFNPEFTGCYESRERIKKLARMTQNLILTAERFGAVCSLMGGEYPELARAWEKILINDFHDVICGTGTDEVYRATVERYESARKDAEEGLKSVIDHISRKIDTRGEGIPMLVFNQLPWEREEIIEVEVDDEREFKVLDCDGAEVPSQRVDGKMLFLARLPPLGYATFYLMAGAPKVEGELAVEDGFLRNKWCRIGVEDRKVLVEYEGSPIVHNEIAVSEDVGNLWTIQETGKWFRHEIRRWRIIERGPLRAGIELEGKCDGARYLKRIYMYSHSPKVDFITTIKFKGRDRRIVDKFVFKSRGKVTHEVPYYAMERGDGHWPVQNWIHWGGDGVSVGVLNRGIPSHQIEGRVLKLGLMRSVSFLSPSFIRFCITHLGEIIRNSLYISRLVSGGFKYIEPMLKYHSVILREYALRGGLGLRGGVNIVDHLIPYMIWEYNILRKTDAMENGEHKFEYCILPHRGDWRDVNMPRRGWEFNNPPIVVKAEPHGGELPKRMWFASIEPENVIMSVLKRGEDDGIVARIYETCGRGTEFKIRLFGGFSSGMKCCMLEKNKIEEISVRGNEISGKIRGWEIATIKLT